jgi:small-conductance mechanosensitive channel
MLKIFLLAMVLTLGAVCDGSAEIEVPPATLRYFNRPIVTFRQSYYGIKPEGRAAQAADRIREALARDGSGNVAMLKTAEGLNVTIDGVYVFRILEGDLDAEDGQTFDQARVLVGERLEGAVKAAKETFRVSNLAWGIGLSGAATLGLYLFIWIFARTRGRLRRWVESRLARKLSLGYAERSVVFHFIQTVGAVIFIGVIVVAVEEWLRFVLGRFPFTRPWSDGLTGYIVGIALQVGAAMVNSVPGLVMVGIIAGLAKVASMIVRTMARVIETGRLRLFGIDGDVVRPARQLATGVIWLFALAMAYPYLPGSNSDAFKGVSVLVGLMVSLGASGLVSQAAGSFILTFSRTLRVGDWVRVGDVEGAVARLGFFATKVRTPTDQEVTIPNSVILTSVTKNFSRPVAAKGSMLETSVTIGYNTPWRQVHALLLKAADLTEGIERESRPEVLQTSLSDFYVQYSLRVRVRDQTPRAAALSALHANIQDIFNQYGVQIMSPHYRFDPDSPVVVPKERWFEPPATPEGERTVGGAPSPGEYSR